MTSVPTLLMDYGARRGPAYSMEWFVRLPVDNQIGGGTGPVAMEMQTAVW
jgi:hypothetical protein